MPQPRRLDEHLEPGLELEHLVLDRGLIADDRVGDVGADVKSRRSGRPVAGALLAADRPPGERRPLQAELARPLPGQAECRVAPEQGVARCVRGRVGEHREDESLRVPEGVAVVAGPGQPFCRNRPLLRARAGLQRVKEREPDGLLELGVSLELDVGGRPEVVEVRPLAFEEAVPARVLGLRDGRDHLVSDRRQRALARPAVRQELDHRQPLAGREIGGDGHPADVLLALGGQERPLGAVDDVVHGGRHQQLAAPGRVQQYDPRIAVREILRLQRGLQHRGRSFAATVGNGVPHFRARRACERAAAAQPANTQ